MSLLDVLRPRCPTCRRRGLRTVQWIRATVVVDGRRGPASWTFYRCPRCAARFRQELRGPLQVAADADWRRWVEASPDRS